MFSFSFGMGILLILIGTFSGIVASLPRSGQWLERVKKILAFLIFVIGLYFTFRAVQYYWF